MLLKPKIGRTFAARAMDVICKAGFIIVWHVVAGNPTGGDRRILTHFPHFIGEYDVMRHESGPFAHPEALPS